MKKKNKQLTLPERKQRPRKLSDLLKVTEEALVESRLDLIDSQSNVLPITRCRHTFISKYAPAKMKQY